LDSSPLKPLFGMNILHIVPNNYTKWPKSSYICEPYALDDL
jgi:hypothetical protein